MEKNLTTGSVFGNIVRFSLPYLFSYFLQTLYGLADLFIIGWFDGVAGTTAVSIGSQVMHMLTVMIVGLAMGATVRLGVLTFVMIGGVLKLIPLTGVTMPFVSYGGTSLVSCMGLIGLLQGVASVNQDDITYDYEISHSMGEQAFMPHADL